MSTSQRHPVDRWIESLQILQSSGVRAWLNGTRQEAQEAHPRDWVLSDIVLTRALCRVPSRAEKEFLRNCDICGQLEGTPAKRRDVRRAWELPLRVLMRGAASRIQAPRRLFAIKLVVYGLDQWTSVLSAFALTRELALLTLWQDWRQRPEIYPETLGAVDRNDLFRSSSLLLMHCAHDYDRFGEEHELWNEVSARGAADEELYRVLLAYCGRGGKNLLTMTADELRRYREPDMVAGYRQLVEVLHG